MRKPEELTPEQIREVFCSHGLRLTHQREAVYRALAASSSHPTAEELHLLARREDAGISLATVYNTLDVLLDAGLARRLMVPRGSTTTATRYDADMDIHVHFVTRDGHVRDVPNRLGDELLRKLPADVIVRIEREMGISVDRVAVKLLGRRASEG
ncbi:MAG: transcriptional repressor [Phycisphaerae bacterium]|nr:transcriptional repressor [Phycisphaerae bacterium]